MKVYSTKNMSVESLTDNNTCLEQSVTTQYIHFLNYFLTDQWFFPEETEILIVTLVSVDCSCISADN